MSKTRIVHHDRLKPYHSDLVPDWVPGIRKSVMQENTKRLTEMKTVGKQTDNTEDTDPPCNNRNIMDKFDTPEPPSEEIKATSRPQRNRRAPKRFGYE